VSRRSRNDTRPKREADAFTQEWATEEGGFDRPKRPKREWKTEEGVFDHVTRQTLFEFMNRGYITQVDCPISTGKEADVYRGPAGPKINKGKGFVAIKIYRVETSDFQLMADYVLADPRFQKVKHSKRHMVYAWARKEYRNLEICQNARVPAPKPYTFSKNVLLMQFLGEEGIPDSTLKNVGSVNPAKDCRTLLGYVRKMYKAGFVHADVSEFNVLVHNYPESKFFIIDVGQGVLRAHPRSEAFLERDVQNVLNYFANLGVNKDFGETMKWVRA